MPQGRFKVNVYEVKLFDLQFPCLGSSDPDNILLTLCCLYWTSVSTQLSASGLRRA
jgi:hypothetical protein